MVYRLIYTSRATGSIDAATIEQIAYLASGRNPEKNLSGILVFSKHIILQVLEGPQQEVEDLFAQISRDTRHSDVMILAEEEAASREFGDDGMAFKHVKKGEKADILTALVEPDYDPVPDHFSSMPSGTYAYA